MALLMNKQTIRILTGSLVLFVSTLTVLAQDSMKILVFSKTAGYRHKSIEAGQLAINQMSREKGFNTVFSEDSRIFTSTSLDDIDVVIFLSTTEDILNEEEQKAFKLWYQSGGGFVGIHAAADTEYNWPWYNELIGAYFESHPPGTHDAKLNKSSIDHPAIKNLPGSWNKVDEWYNYKSIQPDIRVLLILDENSYEGGTNGPDHPIAWFREFDGGKMFYTGLGHTPQTYSDPKFLDHLWIINISTLSSDRHQ